VRVQNRRKSLVRSRGVQVAGWGLCSATNRGEHLERLPTPERPLAELLPIVMTPHRWRDPLFANADRLFEGRGRRPQEAEALESADPRGSARQMRIPGAWLRLMGRTPQRSPAGRWTPGFVVVPPLPGVPPCHPPATT